MHLTFTEQTEVHGAKDSGRRGMHVELAISILDMARDGVPGDAEPLADLRVTAADRQQAQHVQFACSERGRIHTGHLRNCGKPIASHGTKVTSRTPMARTPTAGSAALNTSGSGLPKR